MPIVPVEDMALVQVSQYAIPTVRPILETQGTWQMATKNVASWQLAIRRTSSSFWQVLLYMMDGLLTPANTSTVEELEKVFVFCMIWAMGSSLTVSDDGTDYQKLFSDWWRGEWKKVS